MLTISLKKFSPQPGERILDAGCGEGRHSFALHRLHCKVVALDRDLTSLRKTQYVLREMDRRGEGKGEYLVLKGDNLSLPFGENTFHRIVCAEVLEHIPDDRQALLELVRVLKPGGLMAVTVPTVLTEAVYGRLSMEYFRTPGGHIRIYDPKGLSKLITGCGLRISSVGFAHSFHSLYWVLRCLCGLHNQEAQVPKLYHRFLHQVVLHPRLSRFENSCNYLFPKSMVFYTQKSSPRGSKSGENTEA